ncbi:MAG: helix-turn-helix domain-containing protein [Actinomycetota bacterium]|nr:helix-turn-helix domain-containing protein [Actinomycetota bacterium]
MASGSRNDSTIGVGPLLRKAREFRGLTIEETARGTKLRADQLRALEEEDFDALPGDVYVRASLRTYAAYLGVDPDEIAGAYGRQADEPSAPAPPPKMDKIERAIAATRLRDDPRLVLIGAAIMLAVLIGFGVVSRRSGAPLPAAIPTSVATPTSAETLDAALDAHQSVDVTVTVDGIPQSFRMSAGETRSFTAEQNLAIRIETGATVHVVVDGRDLGVPGKVGVPWTRAWSTQTEGSLSPSASSGL